MLNEKYSVIIAIAMSEHTTFFVYLHVYLYIIT